MNSLTSMRPFQIILLTVFGLLALVGLYAFANYTGFGGSASSVGTVVIWGTLPQAAMTQELGALSSANKSFGKVSYVQQQPATFDTNLANAIASGDGPDMIIMTQEQLLEEQSKLNIIPYSAIPQRTFTSSYLPEDSLFLTTTGTYGVPFVLDPLVLYYNTTLLSQAGIALPPSSWEAVTGLVPTLTRENSAQSIIQSAIALGTYANIEDARAILSLLFFQAGSPITQVSNLGVRSVLSGQQNAAIGTGGGSGSSPATSALSFYTQFADPSRTVYSWNASFPSAQQAFVAGNSALYVGFASEEPLLKAANPNLTFDMAPIPQLQSATKKTDYGLAYAFAIPKASKNPSGAYAAATALTSAAQLPAVASALSMAPAQRALLTTSPTDQFSPVYYPEALISSGWLSPAPATTDSIFSAMISTITSGALQTQNALETADQALDAALPSAQ